MYLSHSNWYIMTKYTLNTVGKTDSVLPLTGHDTNNAALTESNSGKWDSHAILTFCLLSTKVISNTFQNWGYLAWLDFIGVLWVACRSLWDTGDHFGRGRRVDNATLSHNNQAGWTGPGNKVEWLTLEAIKMRSWRGTISFSTNNPLLTLISSSPLFLSQLRAMPPKSFSIAALS